jgi:crotonobetainyl-CoA:carnitine CoA-transferase CaiB-like acyl-CoA transferase
MTDSVRSGCGSSGGPLEGIKVLDFSRLLPGGFATALLGDLGADVLKVEQVSVGDPLREFEPRIGSSSAFSWITDRNKRSISLNLRGSRGAEIARALARDADVAVEGFRPGVMDRLGLGYDALRAVNPALVYCSITGYGADGPSAGEAGHDINFIARAGMLSVTGTGDQPVMPGVAVADLGGSLYGVAGLLAALVRAQRTGEGDHVDVSMTDAAFALQAMLLGPFFVEGRPPGFETGVGTGAFPCYTIYTCADGRHVVVGALEEPFWRRLCEKVGRPDLVGTRMDAAALPVWREVFLTRTRDEWMDLLGDADACVSPVNDLAEAVADRQLGHRRMVIELEHPTAGVQAQVGTPIKLQEHPASVRSPGPEVGDSTREILLELGYTSAEIDGLLADRVARETTAAGRR